MKIVMFHIQILVIGLLLTSIDVLGQDSTYYAYNKLIQCATEFVEVEKYSEATKYYDAAFEQIDCVPSHYYDAFEAAVNDNNYSKANYYLCKGALNGLDLSYWSSDEIMLFNKSAFSRNYWLVKDSLLNVHFNSIDLEYFNALQLLKELDQADRSGSEESQIRDSLNFEELISLSETKGFPTYMDTGYGMEKATLLLWHHRGNEYPNSMQWQRIVPLIQRGIEDGKIDPQFFEVFEDYNKKLK